ncbi:MAG: hypothetical protein KatS3mg057_1614 [Herpetosiphonaceae bacterium]|nr:MAG: hypothetical protein KatS3mg057_1614 [Herpetosiphonaceae bacterium]
MPRLVGRRSNTPLYLLLLLVLALILLALLEYADVINVLPAV